MTTILNRNFEHPADGWYHIEAKGKHVNRSAGVVQVIDDQACASIVNRFNDEAARPGFAGMLIDHEHFRHDTDKETRAYGWLTQLQNRADGIYGQIRWTETGQRAVDGGDYRYFSTEYKSPDCAVLNSEGKLKTIRPLRMDGLSLTNANNNKGQRPITNRQDNFPSGVSAPAADQPKTKRTMKTVCTLLGLSADASEESVHAAVTSVLNRAKTAEEALAPIKNRADAAEAKVKTLEADAVEATLDKFKNRFPAEKRDGWKKALIANRETTMELLEGLPEAQASAAAKSPARVHNRDTAKEPASALGQDEAALAEKRREAVEQYRVNNRCSHEQATNAIRRKSPELFGLEKKA